MKTTIPTRKNQKTDNVNTPATRPTLYVGDRPVPSGTETTQHSESSLIPYPDNLEPSTAPLPALCNAPPPTCSSAPSESATIDAIQRSRIESLKRKQRADAFLNSLTLEQANRLLQWMQQTDSLIEIHKRVTAAPPAGLGAQTTVSTLRRLRAHWRAITAADATEEMFDAINDLETASDLSQSARIETAVAHLLRRRAFDLAVGREPDDLKLKDVLSDLQKLSVLDYKRQKIQLEREKLQQARLNALRENSVRHHRVDLNVVSTSSQPMSSPQPGRGATLPDRQPAQLIAPIPEVVL